MGRKMRISFIGSSQGGFKNGPTRALMQLKAEQQPGAGNTDESDAT
jgi:hypothetical protein